MYRGEDREGLVGARFYIARQKQRSLMKTSAVLHDNVEEQAQHILLIICFQLSPDDKNS